MLYADAIRLRLMEVAGLAGTRSDRPAWPGYGLPPGSADYGLPASAFIVAPARHQAVFRLLGYRPEPQVRDFQSNLAKDRPRGPDEPYVDYLGVSVFSSETSAVENGIRWPKHVAAVLLPDHEGFSIARTYPEIYGHYTVWGDPERLLANVERVATYGEGDRVEEG